MSTVVCADLRWPTGTGIGAVQRALLRRVPADVEIIDLNVEGRIGSPFSPSRITRNMLLKGKGAQVFWSPGFVPPLYSTIPTIVTVHDLTHLHFYSRFHAIYYRRVLRPLYRRCATVICVSEFTRREFLDWSGMAPERVLTVHNGPPEISQPDEKISIAFSHPYVFYPGNHRPYKNLLRLVEAYCRSGLPEAGVHLVMTGPGEPALRQVVAERGIDHFLHFTGWMSDAELAHWYAGAVLVAYVSLYEGFGMPILEAWKAGVPLLSSECAALPEIAGAGALYVDAESVDSIAAGLKCLVSDEDIRRGCIKAGTARLQRFTWDNSAMRIWDAVRAAREAP